MPVFAAREVRYSLRSRELRVSYISITAFIVLPTRKVQTAGTILTFGTERTTTIRYSRFRPAEEPRSKAIFLRLRTTLGSSGCHHRSPPVTAGNPLLAALSNIRLG